MPARSESNEILIAPHPLQRRESGQGTDFLDEERSAIGRRCQGIVAAVSVARVRLVAAASADEQHRSFQCIRLLLRKSLACSGDTVTLKSEKMPRNDRAFGKMLLRARAVGTEWISCHCVARTNSEDARELMCEHTAQCRRLVPPVGCSFPGFVLRRKDCLSERVNSE